MIQAWLSKYHWRYPRSLIYMLQASEYSIRDYLSWFHGTADFRGVEKRKQLVKTPKAILLLASIWVLALILAFSAVIFLLSGQLVLFILVVLAAPYFLAYAITIPLLLGQILVQRPIELFSAAKIKRRLADHKAVKIAIAGSYGKTSMREILKTVLAEGKKVAAPSSSYNTPHGINRFVRNLKGDEEVLIFELGEYYPGDIRKLCELVNPEIGIITGVNEAHLEKFKNINRTVGTIFELADWLGSRPFYVNVENILAKENALTNSILYGRHGFGEWTVENASTGLEGTEFILVRGGDKYRVKTKLLGLHQIGPLIAAADIAFRLGMSMDKIIIGLERTKPFEHRLESKTDSSGVITIDDSYNGNPDGVKAVIDFLESLKGHRRFYVTPGLVEMGSRIEAVHKEIGRQLAHAGIEKTILIKNSVTGYIAQGLKEFGYAGEVIWFNDGPSAFKALSHITVTGDVVLLQNDWPDQYS